MQQSQKTVRLATWRLWKLRVTSPSSYIAVRKEKFKNVKVIFCEKFKIKASKYPLTDDILKKNQFITLWYILPIDWSVKNLTWYIDNFIKIWKATISTFICKKSWNIFPKIHLYVWNNFRVITFFVLYEMFQKIGNSINKLCQKCGLGKNQDLPDSTVSQEKMYCISIDYISA